MKISNSIFSKLKSKSQDIYDVGCIHSKYFTISEKSKKSNFSSLKIFSQKKYGMISANI